MKVFFLLLLALSGTCAISANAQSQSSDEQIAARVMEIWKEPLSANGQALANWNKNQALVLNGIDAVWRRTGNGDAFRYIQKSIDPVLNPEGSFKFSNQEGTNQRVTNQKASIQQATDQQAGSQRASNQQATNFDIINRGRAILLLYKVTGQARYFKAATLLYEQANAKIKNQQIGAQEFYSAGPFLAAYADLIQDRQAFDAIAASLISMKKQNNNLGWYGMALVDLLDYCPANHPRRAELLGMLNSLATSIQKAENPSSASNMFVYILKKGMRKGWLPASYTTYANKAYRPINLDAATTHLDEASPFMLAANEMELSKIPQSGKGKTVLLDDYFNSEKKTDQSGHEIHWHYKWDEMSNGGFSLWGEQFQQQGFKLATLSAAPTAANLKQASVYIIVDPDIEKENPQPNYILEDHIREITDWVKTGGKLVIMANDTGNTELDHLNQLVSNFGMQFNKDSKGRVIGKQFEMGEILIPSGNQIFKQTKRIHVKEYSTLKLQAPAQTMLKDKEGNIVIAVAKIGKGTVFAIGDPWLYNEYTDGRKLPAEYENYKAGAELVHWLSTL